MLKGQPGRPGEVVLDLFQQLVHDVLVMLLVPLLAQVAVRIGQLQQHRFLDRRRPMLPAPPEGLHAMSRDLAQPATKGTGALSLEARQFADENSHHLLNEIIGVVAQFESR